MKKKIEVIATQELKELNDSKSTYQSYGKELPIIDEVKIDNRSQYKRTLLETREVLSTSNHKFLKVWEFYEPTEPSSVQWEYSKRGLFIPIKDAKKWIKRMYQHYFD